MAVEYGGWFMLRVVQVRALVHLVGLTGPLFGISVLLLAAGVYMALKREASAQQMETGQPCAF